MTDCDKGTGNCPPKYKNIRSESFGNKRRVTSEMLYQFCKNDAYLYEQVKLLWDKSDPEHRKRFYPPYYMDINKSYGVEPTVFETLSNNDKALIRPLTSAYHLSNTKREEYLIDFDYKTDNSTMMVDSNGEWNRMKINNDSIIEEDSTLEIVSDVDEDGNITHTVLPVPKSRSVEATIPFTTYTTETVTTTTTTSKNTKVKTKEDVYGKLTLDAHCSGPYKNWNNNSVWYIGYNRHKNYNIKNKWKKNPDDTTIPAVCRAQTFKAEHTGELRKCTFLMRGSKKSVSPCILEVRTTKKGKPTNKVLARTEQKFNHTTKSMVNFTFKKPCKVKKGETYALVFRSPLSNFEHCYWLGGWASTCFSNTRKRAYYGGDTFLSEDNGKTWTLHGTREKCYGSHYYDWGFAEAPVNFGFEVYIAPKTGTKTKKTTVPKTTTQTVTQDVIVPHPQEYLASAMINYYPMGDYYLNFKAFKGNLYTKVDCKINPDSLETFSGDDYTWEIYNTDIKDWQSFDDFDYKTTNTFSTIEFSKALSYVKLRLKLHLNDNIISDDIVYTELKRVLGEIEAQSDAEWNEEKIREWQDEVLSQFAWVKETSEPAEIETVNSLEINLDKKPSHEGYLRSIEYEPVQEGMLPACIWSEVNTEAVTKGDGEVKIDIVHEMNSIYRVLFFTADSLELEPYILDYYELHGNTVTINSNEDVLNITTNTSTWEPNEEFVAYLQEQTPKCYIIPYKQAHTKTVKIDGTDTTVEEDYVYYFGNEEYAPVVLADYPAYPMNSINVGMEDISINLKDQISQFTKKDNNYIIYTHDKDLTDKVDSIEINYSHILEDNPNEIVVDTISLVENQDWSVDGDTIIFNLTQNYKDKDGNTIDDDDLGKPLLSTFLRFDDGAIKPVANQYLDNNNTILYVKMKGFNYNEFQDYIVDYDNKTLNFWNPHNLVEGELKIQYNPLWVRDLTVDDFPLKMDLWTEYYQVRINDNTGTVYFDKCKIGPCGKIIPNTDKNGDTYMRTSVPPLDNLRVVEIQDMEGNAIETKNVIEDIDFTVDYINSIITWTTLNKLEDGDVIMIKYTPNLTDTGLSIAYRMKRPLYESVNSTDIVEDDTITDTYTHVRTNEDDVFALNNYFTTRT